MTHVDEEDISPNVTPEEIRRGRKVLGLTLARLASIVGADPAVVEVWEGGAEPCPLSGAMKFKLAYLGLRSLILEEPEFRAMDRKLGSCTKCANESPAKRRGFRRGWR